MSLARVEAVAPGSPAHGAGVQVGDELVDVNGEELRDVIRYQVQVDEPNVALTLRRGETTRQVQIDKAAGEPLGVELDSAVFDRVRTCDNHCPFCFIYQLPKGMRKSLYLKDDDYRLSFLYGNFTTLTRFTEADLERVITEGLGPLYVSIHATDPEVRTALLRNRRGATSLRWLGLLLDAGRRGARPDRGVSRGQRRRGARRHAARAFSIGSLGLHPSVRCRSACRTSPPKQTCGRIRAPKRRPCSTSSTRGRRGSSPRWVIAWCSPPTSTTSWPTDRFRTQTRTRASSNTRTGLVWPARSSKKLPTRRRARSVPGVGARAGFFAWVDGAPATGYRAPRTSALSVVDARSADRTDAPVVILTGEYGARVLEPMVPTLTELSGVDVSIMPVANSFFGGNIAVTGLLTGADITGALAGVPADARVLVPDVVLSEDRFLDGLTLADLPRPVEVVGTDGASLVGALDRRHALVGVAS